MDTHELPLYVTHPGTVKVSGSTVPRKAARCAQAFLEEHRKNVEFLFIGASAGQQALKALGILGDMFETQWKGDYALVFRPLRYRTYIESHDPLLSGQGREVDAQVWRVHVLDLKYLSHES